MENSRLCKDCGEPLSSDTKGDVCEYCKNKRAKKRKKIVEGVLGTLGAISGIAITVVKLVPGVGDKISRG